MEFFDGHDPLLIKLRYVLHLSTFTIFKIVMFALLKCIDFRFDPIDDVARTLSLYLSEELACILKYL